MASDRPLPGAAHLECTATGERFDSETLQGLSPAGKPLFARYDLAALRGSFTPEALRCRRADLWRYEEVLPVRDRRHQVALGEGWTPLLESSGLPRALGVGRVWVKDEGVNPTGSFKARGLALAVSRARELGATELALPSAGNAGGALAAYGARAGLPVDVFLPRDTPLPFELEARLHGAGLVDGIADDIHDPTQRGIAHRHGDGASGGDGLHASDHAVGRRHGDAPRPVLAQVLCHLDDDVDRLGRQLGVVLDADRLQDRRQAALVELDVDGRADYLNHPSRRALIRIAHRLSLSPGRDYSASAPATTSRISVVISS